MKFVNMAAVALIANASAIKISEGLKDDVVLMQSTSQNGVLRARRITDEDGDGVEDNEHKTRSELDRFYIPAVFGVVEDIHNTHHGNLPGHTRLEEEEKEPESKPVWTASDFTGFADLHLRI